MKHTRIAGKSFDQRHARLVHQTARIYTYASHIRRLAHDAALPVETHPLTSSDEPDLWDPPARASLRRP